MDDPFVVWMIGKLKGLVLDEKIIESVVIWL